MSRSVIAVSGQGHVAPVNIHPKREGSSRVAGTLVTTLAVLWSAHAGLQPEAASAGQDSPAGIRPDVKEGEGTPSPYVTESRKALNDSRDTLAGVGERLLAGIKPRVAPDRDVTSQSLFVESAKAHLEAANLALEAAQLELKAFQDAVSKNQERECEAELELAQGDVKRAAPKIEQANDRNGKIPRAAPGSLMQLSQDWQFEAQLRSLQLEGIKARYAIESAQAKFRMLNFEKTKHTTELRAEIEKARSNVLARQATLMLEQSKLEKARQSRNEAVALSPSQARTLELLEAAIPIEEEWNAKLKQCAKSVEPSALVAKEVRDLARRLAAIVDLAREQEADKSLEKLKSYLAH